MQDSFVIHVCIPHTFRNYYSYTHTQAISPGSRVRVPFRHKMRIGFVLETHQNDGDNLTLKAIDAVIDNISLVPSALSKLCQWVSTYYQAPLSEVLPLAIPKRMQAGHSWQRAQEISYILAINGPAKGRRQQQLLERLAQGAMTKTSLLHAGFTAIQLKTLLQAGFIQEIIQPKALPVAVSKPLNVLNTEQAVALDAITKHLQEYQCFLLNGVTGSGKTEVYLHLCQRVLAKRRQVLILVPEIGLTPQLQARFTCLATPMVILHSKLNDSERETAWHLARTGEARIVLGTRSAVFTPLPELGLIIIDEEHDASLKQMEGVRYSARDTALMRAHMTNIPIVLGSATPSLESLYNCQRGKSTQLLLTQRALTKTPLHFQLIDLRKQNLQHGIAPETLEHIRTHLANNNQVLVFINRRGFAPVLLCHQCGWMADCQACDSHLTLHRTVNKLICHHCGLMHRLIHTCRSCHSTDLVPIGSGTQRIYDYLATVFPTTSILRIDRDEVGQKHALAERLEQIRCGEAQLIVGTQMLAKGHDFPRLTLVVVLDTDNGFYNQDFRALERLGQLLTQVAGRAGRAASPGQVVIQTHVPQHPLLTLLLSQGYMTFAEALLDMRYNAQLPPYHFIALLRAKAKQPASLLQLMHAVKEHLHPHNLELLGPAPAPLARKANYHRMQLLIKGRSRQQLHHALTGVREWLTMTKFTGGVRWSLDIDPVDLS